jgi:hypothetical protein
LWALLPGCDRTHLHPSYGRATRRALRTQIIDPEAGARAKPTQGLDPEEAAIVAESYRKSLSPRQDDKAAARAPVLLLGPGMQAPGGAPMQ